ncbi:DUF2585 domain-containing protein [Roseomonas sp. USHLN139]|uniref:DUF2585 domain-containing protein n=1 Tax=Roseomonas sp. USHLN139 TaxID=3081298 RepID=UPI003B01ADA3
MRRPVFGVLAIAAVMAAVLLAMGRVPICSCGEVLLWYGQADGPGNSQHIADWYTPSHIIHGFLFFAALAWVRPGWSVGARMVVASLVEAAWEVAENSPMVIDRYREATLAAGYQGDSVLNSLADLGWMLLGFAIAARLPWKATLALGVFFELLALYAIRDNLTLNVLMLLWPVEGIRDWQAAG